MNPQLPSIPQRSISLPNSRKVKFQIDQSDQQFDLLLKELVTKTQPKTPQRPNFRRGRIFHLPQVNLNNIDMPDYEVLPAQISPHRRKVNMARLQRLNYQQDTQPDGKQE